MVRCGWSFRWESSSIIVSLLVIPRQYLTLVMFGSEIVGERVIVRDPFLLESAMDNGFRA